MHTIKFDDINEGDLITFQRRTKNKETVKQLGFVSRTNKASDANNAPIESIEIYPVVDVANAPNVRFKKSPIPQEQTEKMGLEGQYILFQIPIKIDATSLAETNFIGALSDEATNSMYDTLDKWEDAAGRNLKFFKPDQLSGTGFMRFTPPSKRLTETHTAAQTPATGKQKDNPAAPKTSKTKAAKGGYKAPRPNGHFPDDAWDIAP
jgi:hypothetical protein